MPFFVLLCGRLRCLFFLALVVPPYLTLYLFLSLARSSTSTRKNLTEATREKASTQKGRSSSTQLGKGAVA